MSGDTTTKFSVLASLFNWMQKSKSSAQKRSKFRKFLDNFCKPSDYFSAIRLILPALDRERGSYGLKESVLATCLVDALGMSRDSEDAVRLFNWRRGGPKTGASAGNFALVALEVLQRRQGMASGGLTIKELNELLDRLASSESRADKTSVLATLINKTNAQEMKWIIMIILKDLKLGVSEKSIFHEFHPDAEDLFNVTCDLKLVCEKLRDRSQRHKRQDIEVGKPVRPQLAMRVANAANAWKKLHGKEVVVECKFDGDRIQVHKNGAEIHFFSRNFLDHSEYEHGMSNIIMQNVLVDRCILDGEMLVWDRSLNRFAEFGSNQEIAKAAREGLESERQLCYVAFDILYAGDTSVIHQSLKERHELLLKYVKPLKGRLEILIPDGGLNNHRAPGDPCCSFVARTLDDVERFFKETIENRDEGIVLKDLGSKWDPGDRSGKWLKLKPDYVHPSSDLDVLIIGGYYGSGRHGGEVAQFLVGLAERPAPNVFPTRFISFCRVGTGLSDNELDAVVTKLKPHMRKYEYPKKALPSFYRVTNHSKERPDVWVESPEKSIILSITSDIRTINSEVFAAPYSLRFPRIDRVRWDKPWHECLDVQSFVELVHVSNGITKKGQDKDQLNGGVQQKRSSDRGKREKKNLLLVPSHFMRTDVSNIKGGTKLFLNMMFYFVNAPSDLSLDTLHKMVVENGGTFSMNMNSAVTHCIAAESKGIKFQAAKRSKDIIHYSWVLDCISQKRLLPLLPKYFLFLSDSSKKKLQEEIDEYSDSYYWDLDLSDIRQLLHNVERSEEASRIEYYKKKFFPKAKWSRFQGCCIYFRTPLQKLKSEWDVLLRLVLKRLKLEVSWGGGKVSEDLSHATHLVILTVSGLALESSSIVQSFTDTEKRILKKKGLCIITSQWLEDCLQKGQRVPEDPYKLIIMADDVSSGEEGAEQNQHTHSFLDKEERVKCKAALKEHGSATSSRTAGTRKRGRPPSVSRKKGEGGGARAARSRPRPGKKAAKISENTSDDGSSSAETLPEDSKSIEDNAINKTKGKGHSVVDPDDSSMYKLDFAEQGGDAEAGNLKDSGEGRLNINEAVMDKHDGPDGKELNKLEIMTDPVHAMLLDMIPSLGMKVETAEQEVKDIKAVSPDKNVKDEKLLAEPSEVLPKKRKVSYKDIAGELLKDW